ncbi:hypothetical protein [Polaromonas sp.]|jgi:hypothetical protein|uniref:hypothetical protein n=1 Tax=Polaromonas sp. TaxID=1869339 RepID=UPI003BB5FD44
MHYASAQATLQVLLSGLAARIAGRRGDTFKSRKQTDMAQDACPAKALATPVLFFARFSFLLIKNAFCACHACANSYK